MSDKKTLMEMVRKIGGVQQVKESRMGEVDMVMQDIASGELDAYQVMTNPQSPEEQAASRFLQAEYDQVARDHRLHPDDDFEQILDIVCDNLCAQYAAESAKPSKEVMEAMKVAGIDEAVRLMGRTSHNEDQVRYPKGHPDPRSQAHRDKTAAMAKKIRKDGRDLRQDSSVKVDPSDRHVAAPSVMKYKSRHVTREMADMLKIAGIPLAERWSDDDYDDDEDRDVKIAMSDKRQQAFEKRAKKVVGKVDPDKDISKMAKNNSKKDDDEEEKPAAKAVPAKKAAPAEKKPAPAAEKKEDAPAKPARGSFTAIVKPMLARGASTADIRAALTKAGVSTNHLHSRLHGLRKGLKEGFVLVHPHMPSFVLAENLMMNQYQWISEKDDATSLQPMLFASEAEAQKVIKYMVDFKNQQAVLTKVQLGD